MHVITLQEYNIHYNDTATYIYNYTTSLTITAI